MATNIFANITQRGTNAAFNEAMANIPTVWDKHVQTVSSDTPDEQYVWLGRLPEPREFISGRSLQGIMDFTYTVADQEFELSFLIDRKSIEDDRHGQINARIQEAAKVWATFKDSQFATLLINGETATTTFDSVTFHDDTRTIGSSAAIDNSLTANITTVNDPTTANLQDALTECKEALWRYEDDQGRTGYNSDAMGQLRCVIPVEYEEEFITVVASDLIGGGDSNPAFKNLVEWDVLPYLTDADNAFYMSALGGEKKPFIYQERTALEVVVLNDTNSVAENNGVKVLTRQRYRLAYGEPRRNIRYDFT